MASSGCGVVLVVPAKHLDQAKSRLGSPRERRMFLACALLRHSLVAARDSGVFDEIVVPTSDSRVQHLALAHGVRPLTEEPGSGLNAAIGLGRDWAARHRPASAVCVMVADLGHSTPEDLRSQIEGFLDLPVASFVPDLAGTGTTMVMLPRGDERPTQFGARSAERHSESGFRAVGLHAHRLRWDVDTLDQVPEDMLARERRARSQPSTVEGSGAWISSCPTSHII